MPEKEKLAWLSMKRRSTTGGVKTINGQMAAVIEEDGGKGDATVALSPTNARPASQPEISRDLSNGTKTDGNLFYAYARKVGLAHPVLMRLLTRPPSRVTTFALASSSPLPRPRSRMSGGFSSRRIFLLAVVQAHNFSLSPPPTSSLKRGDTRRSND
jgi:hypothetical protein